MTHVARPCPAQNRTRRRPNMQLSGGYEDGYSCCSCFWGRSAGSLVSKFLSATRSVKGLQALDLGCGEGKNAYALARAGADVIAVDCSERAINNGEREFPNSKIKWVISDAETYLISSEKTFDLIVMYGLLHCLPSAEKIKELIKLALDKTRSDGVHIVASFNDGPHDLSAHPGFLPTLMPHDFFLRQYAGHVVLSASNSRIDETHPHNQIPHFHSLTRLVARKSE
jgi:tellurite methyltransferase